MKNKETSSTSWYHPDSKNITLTITQKPENKKFSDQSLNSHASDEYYDEEELEEDIDPGDSDHSSGDGGDTFNANLLAAVVDDTDLMDGNILQKKKTPTNRFFSRLVEATSSFSNSTPSLPSMIKRPGGDKSVLSMRSAALNAFNASQWVAKERNNDVQLHSAKFYLNESDVIVGEKNDGSNILCDKKNAALDSCDCWNEEYEYQNRYLLCVCEELQPVTYSE